MKINNLIWLEKIVDKLAVKHQVEIEEVEELFQNYPRFRYVEKGKQLGEDVYLASGQTEAGRYLTVLFIHQANSDALILSARDMANWERKRYGRK
jgi:hypothetical protein